MEENLTQSRLTPVKIITRNGKNKHNTCVIYLTSLFYIAEIFHWVPFRIVKNNFIESNPDLLSQKLTHNYCIQRRSKLSTFICAFIQIGALLIGFCSSYKMVNVTGSAAKIMSIISAISQFSIVLIASCMLWIRQDLLLEIINLMSDLDFLKRRNYNKWFWKLKVSVVVIAAVIINFLHGFSSIHHHMVLNYMTTNTLEMINDILQYVLPTYCYQKTIPIGNCLHIVFENCLYFWFFMSFRLSFFFEFSIVVLLVYILILIGNDFVTVINKTKSVDKVK